MPRRLANDFIVIYAFLATAIMLRTLLGLPFQLWLAMFLPLVSVAFALAHSVTVLRWRRALLFLGLTLAISLALESLGVATGQIYGPYHYTSRLGPLFLGLVPYTIPLTWYMMLYPAYRIAERCVPARWQLRWLAVAALGGLAMVAWDLAMDPLMASRSHWVWDTSGAYYGVPLQNFLGWWLTAFIILSLYLKLSQMLLTPLSADNDRFDRLAVLSYALTGLGSVADAALSGLGGPALIGGATMLIAFIWGWRRTGLNPGVVQHETG
jgi:uncharacterized membrane protein